MALKPFYNKKGHLGMTRQQLLEKLNDGGLTPVDEISEADSFADPQPVAYKYGEDLIYLFQPNIAQHIPVDRGDDNTFTYADQLVGVRVYFGSTNIEKYVRSNIKPPFLIHLSYLEIATLAGGQSVSFMLPDDFTDLQYSDVSIVIPAESQTSFAGANIPLSLSVINNAAEGFIGFAYGTGTLYIFNVANNYGQVTITLNIHTLS